MSFQEALQSELDQRQRSNPRYSLRAFARDLGTDHATLSQILRSRRNLSPRMVQLFGSRLRLSPAIISDACQEQQAQAILRLIRSLAFRPSSRWIATQTNIPLDAVNAALHRLLHRGKLVMKSPHHWSTTGASHA